LRDRVRSKHQNRENAKKGNSLGATRPTKALYEFLDAEDTFAKFAMRLLYKPQSSQQQRKRKAQITLALTSGLAIGMSVRGRLRNPR